MNLSLDRWRQIDAGLVLRLVTEYGEADTLRILNGPPKPEPPAEPVPFDRSLLAPPGAVGRRHGRRSQAQGVVVEASGWA